LTSGSLLRSAAGAFAFLTIVPLGYLHLGERDVGRGVVLFPLVGALLGGVVALVGLALEDLLTAFLAAGVAVTCVAVATGGVGARSRERALEIMRESAIGAFGAAALALDLLLKTGALAVLLTTEDSVLVIATAYGLGRAAPLALAWALPYARTGAGSGRALTDSSPWALLGGGLVLACALGAALVGLDVLALVGGAAAGTAVIAAAAAMRLGGVTGDVLGAGIELATTASLLAAVAVA
jgi:adenosylcobinamide-GDP ribazoletransferase